MPVNLSIKNAPDEMVEKLRKRAKRNHRSLQGELISILEEAADGNDKISIDEFVRRSQALGLSTPDEATGMIREDRDR